MKLQPFNYAASTWDAYRRLHVGATIRPDTKSSPWNVNNTPFIQFETGELIVKQCKFDPDDRREYTMLDVSVRGTTDDRCPDLYDNDGIKLKKAWITSGGSQILLHDHQHETVVRLDHRVTNKAWDKVVPEGLKIPAMAYFPGAGKPAIPRAMIEVSRPVIYNAEEKAHIKDIIAACRSWHALTTDDNKRETIADLETTTTFVLGWDFNGISPSIRRSIAVFGVKQQYTAEEHVFLHTKPPKI